MKIWLNSILILILGKWPYLIDIFSQYYVESATAIFPVLTTNQLHRKGTAKLNSGNIEPPNHPSEKHISTPWFAWFLLKYVCTLHHKIFTIVQNCSKSFKRRHTIRAPQLIFYIHIYSKFIKHSFLEFDTLDQITRAHEFVYI